MKILRRHFQPWKTQKHCHSCATLYEIEECDVCLFKGIYQHDEGGFEEYFVKCSHCDSKIHLKHLLPDAVQARVWQAVCGDLHCHYWETGFVPRIPVRCAIEWI